MAVLLRFSSLLAAHADWSVDPRKRWITKAHRRAGRWHLGVPEPVGAVQSLLERLSEEAAGTPVAFGVDFPLGLPRAYAARAAIADYPAWLRALAPDSPLFLPCATLDEVSLARPFYPKSSVAGAGQMARQAAALGLDGPDALRRAVDQPTARRPGGAPMFWTMGANQCGKAGLAAWRDCLLPALAQGQDLAFWPFEGGFTDLIEPGRVVLAETYPAEVLVQLGLRLRGSKRRQADRAALAEPLHSTLTQLEAIADPALATMIEDGFGPGAYGEDRFDCLIGVLGVIRVLAGAPDGFRNADPPHDAAIGTVEGWVLGQVDRPAPARASAPPLPDPPTPQAPQRPRGDPPPAGSG